MERSCDGECLDLFVRHADLFACAWDRWYLTRTGQTQSSADMFQSEVQLEGGYQAEGEEDIREALRALGHHVHDAFVNGAARSMFGKAQVILQDHARGISIAGSDPRSDGCAIPLL